MLRLRKSKSNSSVDFETPLRSFLYLPSVEAPCLVDTIVPYLYLHASHLPHPRRGELLLELLWLGLALEPISGQYAAQRAGEKDS